MNDNDDKLHIQIALRVLVGAHCKSVGSPFTEAALQLSKVNRDRSDDSRKYDIRYVSVLRSHVNRSCHIFLPSRSFNTSMLVTGQVSPHEHELPNYAEVVAYT